MNFFRYGVIEWYTTASFTIQGHFFLGLLSLLLDLLVGLYFGRTEIRFTTVVFP